MTNMHSKKVHQMLVEGKALWMYPGEPRADVPHALLASGLHSNGFATPGPLLKKDPVVCRRFAEMLHEMFCSRFSPDIDKVVGAATSSTPLAAAVAQMLGAEHIEMEKEDGTNRQLWLSKNKLLRGGETILQVEELMTTGFSARNVRNGIAEANPEVGYRFAPHLVVVVDRSLPKVPWIDDSEVLSLLRLEIENFDPETCPYCEAGSEAIPPKKGNNWERLTQVA